MPRRDAGAYIVSVVGHPYLTTLLPLWLTMSSYPSTTPAVLVVRHASAGRPYDRWRPPYLHPTSFPRRVDHIGGPVVRGRKDVAT
ncbi:hypothetical protein GW17_00032549, partial [Ensete ventricosum]